MFTVQNFTVQIFTVQIFTVQILEPKISPIPNKVEIFELKKNHFAKKISWSLAYLSISVVYADFWEPDTDIRYISYTVFYADLPRCLTLIFISSFSKVHLRFLVKGQKRAIIRGHCRMWPSFNDPSKWLKHDN